MVRMIDKERDREIDIQSKRDKGREIDRQIDRWIEIEKQRQINRQINKERVRKVFWKSFIFIDFFLFVSEKKK